MHRKSFLIKDILQRQHKSFSDLNDYSSSECAALINPDSYFCKTDNANLYSTNSSWPFASNNCLSCVNSIATNSSTAWPTVLCTSSEKLVSLQNRCKDAFFNGLYYNTQSIGQPFLDNLSAFETASDVLSTSSSLEVTESIAQPIVACSMSSTTATVSTSSSSSQRKVRRNRTVFTELQLMGLERRFDSQKYLSTPDRSELARALGLTQLQVKTWYQVMQGGCPIPPTKPKGRPKKNSIPSLGMNLENTVALIGVSHKSSNLQSLLQQNVVHSQTFNH